MAKIIVVAGDLGGLQNFLPVILKLLQKGHTVLLHLSAGSESMYKVGALRQGPFVDISDLPGFSVVCQTDTDIGTFVRSNNHAVLVICTSQSEVGAKLAQIAAMNSTKSIVVVEDYYRSSGPLLKDSIVAERISKICVIDAAAARLVLSFHPDMRMADWSHKIEITGGPRFDELLEIKPSFAVRCNRTRYGLGLKPDQICFLIVGGLNGTEDMMKIASDAASKIGCSGQMILAPHPTRQTEMDVWKTHLACGALDNKPLLIRHRNLLTDYDIFDLLVASNLVLGSNSTLLHQAILLAHPGVVYCSSPAIAHDRWREKGLIDQPEVTAGAAWQASSGHELVTVMSHMTHGTESFFRVVRKQAEMASRCGGAAQRVFEVIEQYC